MIDKDISKEYDRQREYLERCVEVLKSKLETDTSKHKSENMKLMQTNMSLIKEIADYRALIKNAKLTAAVNKDTSKKAGSPSKVYKDPNITQASEESLRLIQQQKEEIGELRAVLSGLNSSGDSGLQKAMSREKLPPMDGREVTPRCAYIIT